MVFIMVHEVIMPFIVTTWFFEYKVECSTSFCVKFMSRAKYLPSPPPLNRFLLLPALLGDLTMQTMGEDRLDRIQKARVYFVDYLQRSKSYSITSEVSVSR